MHQKQQTFRYKMHQEQQTCCSNLSSLAHLYTGQPYFAKIFSLSLLVTQKFRAQVNKVENDFMDITQRHFQLLNFFAVIFKNFKLTYSKLN